MGTVSLMDIAIGAIAGFATSKVAGVGKPAKNALIGSALAAAYDVFVKVDPVPEPTVSSPIPTIVAGVADIAQLADRNGVLPAWTKDPQFGIR